MKDIFISYAHQDRDKARQIAEALEEMGWSVFRDRTIPAGQTWRTHVGKALKEAKCVIVAWSQASCDSEWVAEEADHAKKRKVLIPVLIENVNPPIGFGSIQAANLVGWDGDVESDSFCKLRDDVARLLDAPPPLIEKQERHRDDAYRKLGKRDRKTRADPDEPHSRQRPAVTISIVWIAVAIILVSFLVVFFATGEIDSRAKPTAEQTNRISTFAYLRKFDDRGFRGGQSVNPPLTGTESSIWDRKSACSQ